ncbi:MAG: hypothetical protein QOD33_1586 [Pyrinomonadaceae bacterium]|jgi:hypothetical protein|nr:hypothetical protein [Pyrinomonadaceae bacterium]
MSKRSIHQRLGNGRLMVPLIFAPLTSERGRASDFSPPDLRSAGALARLAEWQAIAGRCGRGRPRSHFGAVIAVWKDGKVVIVAQLSRSKK